MQLSDLLDQILATSANDWNDLDPTHGLSTPLLFTFNNSSGCRVDVEEHTHVAVLRDDVSVSLAWGVHLDGPAPSGEYPWRDRFLDKSVVRSAADIRWHDSVVHRVQLAYVDGGLGLLPMPTARLPSGRASAPVAGLDYVINRQDLRLVRLLRTLAGGTTEEVDFYLRMSGFPVE